MATSTCLLGALLASGGGVRAQHRPAAMADGLDGRGVFPGIDRLDQILGAPPARPVPAPRNPLPPPVVRQWWGGCPHPAASAEAIRRVVLRNLGQVRACYQQALWSQPRLAGRVELRFLIIPTGSVQESLVSYDALASPFVGGCVAKAIVGWTFVPTDAFLMVNYPFTFEAVVLHQAPGPRAE